MFPGPVLRAGSSHLAPGLVLFIHRRAASRHDQLDKHNSLTVFSAEGLPIASEPARPLGRSPE